MTSLHDYQESITQQMRSGVNYLLSGERVLTAELAKKVGKTIEQHSELASVSTYEQIRSKAENGYVSESDAVSLAHALSAQLVGAVKGPLDRLLTQELGTTDIGSHDGLWYGLSWLDDDPNLTELRLQADVI